MRIDGNPGGMELVDVGGNGALDANESIIISYTAGGIGYYPAQHSP